MAEKTTRRILVFATNYLPNIGGAELAFNEVARRIPEMEFDLIASRLNKLSRFDGSLPPEEKFGNVNVYRVGSRLDLTKFLLPKNLYPVTAYLKARELSKKFGPYKIIYALQASQGGGGAWLFKTFNPGVIFLLNLQEGKNLERQGFLTNFFRKLIIKKADIVVAISNYLADYARKINSRAKVEVIPNGVDLRQFSIFNFQLPITEKKEKIIITVSRLVPKNGMSDLIEAFKLLITNYQLPIKLLIIGAGPLKEKLKLQITNYKLQDKIKLIGEISHKDIIKHLAMADVFVRPSLSEGLGTAFLEAMVAGVPIIGTPAGGIPDFLKDGETGIFCKISDPEDLADKIKRILSDWSLREKIINNAKKLITEKYDWNIIARKFNEIYDHA